MTQLKGATTGTAAGLALALLYGLTSSAPADTPKPRRKNPPPLTDADLKRFSRAQIQALFAKVSLPEDDPNPDAGNEKKGTSPGPEALRHRGMDYGPCLAFTVQLPDKGRAVLRGLTVKLPHEAALCYDLDTLGVAAAWTGGFLDLSGSNLENSKGKEAARPGGKILFVNSEGPGWGQRGKLGDPRKPRLGPLPDTWVKYHGHYLHGAQVVLAYDVHGARVLEMPGAEKHDGLLAVSRTLRLDPSREEQLLRVGPVGVRAAVVLLENGKARGHTFPVTGHLALVEQKVAGEGPAPLLAIGVVGAPANARWDVGEQGCVLRLPPNTAPLLFKILCYGGEKSGLEKFKSLVRSSAGPSDPLVLLKGGPKRWGQPLVTTAERGQGSGPYVVDTLTLPRANPFKSWMRTAALDCFADGRLAVSTFGGDVWVVGGAVKGERLTWTRYATGLYEPLGLRVVNDVVYVLGRDRITRLHDFNGDGEADYYESFFAGGNVAPSFHAFSFDLQTDRAGNFYFLKSGRRVESDRPGHGTLMRVSPDGRKSAVVATGFRHPNGMGIGPRDEIVVSDNQGEWVPASKVSLVRPGGFYGYVPKDREADPPARSDPALFWLPMSVDNSSGGQCWAGERWGPLSGKLLHTSYGRCALFYVMVQRVGDAANAAAVELPLAFRSGIMRARVNPADGQVYVTGLRGWQTTAKEEGCVQRVRYTGAKACLVDGFEVVSEGIRLHFSAPLERTSAGEAKNYRLQEWNYIWSRYYGSPHMSVRAPTKRGQDKVAVEAATVSADGKAVFLRVPGVGPVHQLRVRLALRSAAGAEVRQTVYATVNAVPGSPR